MNLWTSLVVTQCSMGRLIIDLSIGIEAGLPSDPEMMIPKIDYVNHSYGQKEDAINYLI